MIPISNMSTLVGVRIRYKWLGSRAATCLLPPTCTDGGPVVHGQVGGPGLPVASAVPQPNQ